MKSLGFIGLILGIISFLSMFFDWDIHWIIPALALFFLWADSGFKTIFSDIPEKEDIKDIVNECLANSENFKCRKDLP